MIIVTCFSHYCHRICRFCNKSKEDHDKTDGKEPMVPTDSFGQIEFMKASRKTRAKVCVGTMFLSFCVGDTCLIM